MAVNQYLGERERESVCVCFISKYAFESSRFGFKEVSILE